MESEQYRSKELKEVAELEAAVGRKQLEIDFLNKLIEIAGEELKADLKKNFAPRLVVVQKSPMGTRLQNESDLPVDGYQQTGSSSVSPKGFDKTKRSRRVH
jgi:hypothetical protein